MSHSPRSASPGPARNRLLARLTSVQYPRLFERLHPVPLEFKTVLYQANGPIDYVYFPTRGMLSAIAIMENGDAIEVGTIGNEGVTGLAVLFGEQKSLTQVLVQIKGEALRIKTAALQVEARRAGPLGGLLQLHHRAFQMQLMQSSACNGLHRVQQRCCRYLLMTHDRSGGDVLPLSHGLLAVALGVRRASVSEVLMPLQERGLIRSHRGEVTVQDRPGLEAACCECYRMVVEAYRRLLG
jgi:CRP-like cAMP-binding protein